MKEMKRWECNLGQNFPTNPLQSILHPKMTSGNDLSQKSNQGSISPTFYEQLFPVQTPKLQKDTDDLTVSFSLLVFAFIKAVRKMLVILTPGESNTLNSTIAILKINIVYIFSDKLKMY